MPSPPPDTGNQKEKGLCGRVCDGLCAQGRARETFVHGIWHNNPIAVQVLGICSVLAVTTRLDNSLVMGLALVLVTALSCLLVSIMRHTIPRRIRMIVEVGVIATFVIVFDLVLKAYYWDMSQRLGPYVGLIITNCIVMGRAEAFALQNPPYLSFVDGVANGLGYGAMLAIIGLIRELAGTGRVRVAGHTLVDLAARGYEPNQLFILAPGAFIALGFLLALYAWLRGETEEAAP